MFNFFLATEDAVSEEVGVRLISELGASFSIGLKFRQGGNGYLKKNIPKFCAIAQQNAFLLITDLDQIDCPVSLISDWLNNSPRPSNLLFRVAVREIEAWLLADHDGVMSLFGSRVANLTENPDSLPDAKRKLLKHAQKAPRSIREDILPEKHAIALTGLGYNRRLTDFVRNVWDPDRAATRSESLRRTRDRLRKYAATL